MKHFRVLKRVWMFILLAGILSLPILAQTYPGPISASDTHYSGIGLPGTIDSWSAGWVRTGYRSWVISMTNHSTATSFSNPTLWINPSGFPFATQSSLKPSQELRLDLSSGAYDMDLGFNSSRTVEPLMIPAGATVLQNVTVSVTRVDSRYDFPAPGIAGTGMYAFIFFGDGTLDTDSVISPDGYKIYYDNPRIEWEIREPSVGPHVFTATLRVTNSDSKPVNHKPEVGARMSIWHAAISVNDSYVDIQDASLSKVVDGATGVHFSVGEPAEWHPRVSDESYSVIYEPLTETVTDTTPPTLTVAVDKGILWPPNHKMVPVTVLVNAYDGESGVANTKITSVTSNEPVDGLGDGDMAPDWVITGDLTLNLRAERSGTGSGRVYTITVVCTDNAGNSASKMVQVMVPHDQEK
jgi:hypothetical protein